MGKVLTEDSHKQYILRQILKFNPEKQVKETNLLYSYPKMKKMSFHEEVDNQNHYVLLIRLQNGMLIGAYSQQGLTKDQTNTGNGFICSISNETVFHLKKHSKARLTQYNEYFIIFGNAQLRIKLGEDYVESNLGISNKFFDTGNLKNPQILFNCAEKQVGLLSYEIFTVVME